jgi:serine/threonine protein kinase
MSESRYQPLGKLGQGGAGEVYLAKDTQLDRDVALKRMKIPEGVTAEQVAQDLMREARTLSTLQHPNIVTIYDVGKDEVGPFVVLEYLKGETLGDVIERGALPLGDFAEVVVQSLEGLIAAHSMGLVHRDLKSDNLMVVWLPSGKFQIKILDFGLSKFSQKARPQTEDHEGGIMGSIFFMAPEQFERLPLDARTDMYSLGCIYYQILAARYPFNGETGTEVMVSHLQHHVEPIHTLRPDLPVWLGHWVMWLISREMDDRPADARTALEYFRAQQHARPGVTTMVPKKPPTHRVPQAAVGYPGRPGNQTQPNAPRGPQMPGPGQARYPASVTLPITHKHPGKKSHLGLYLLVGAGLVALAGGWYFLKYRKTAGTPTKGKVTSKEQLAERLNNLDPATSSNKNAEASPAPSSELPASSTGSVVAQLEDTVFARVKLSDRLKAFRDVLTKANVKYDPKIHGPLLRQIPHDTSADFAKREGDFATQKSLQTLEAAKMEVKDKREFALKMELAHSYPENAISASSRGVTGWTSSKTAIGWDLGSLNGGTWTVSIDAETSMSGLKLEVTLGQNRHTATFKGGKETVELGEFQVDKTGSYRLWIRCPDATSKGELAKLSGVMLKKK